MKLIYWQTASFASKFLTVKFFSLFFKSVSWLNAAEFFTVTSLQHVHQSRFSNLKPFIKLSIFYYNFKVRPSVYLSFVSLSQLRSIKRQQRTALQRPEKEANFIGHYFGLLLSVIFLFFLIFVFFSCRAESIYLLLLSLAIYIQLLPSGDMCKSTFNTCSI